jgi:hypothetical protein
MTVASQRGEVQRTEAGFLYSTLCSEDTQLSTAREDETTESSSLLGPGRNGGVGRNTEQQMKIIKAILYAVQVFYSFFIM